MTALSVLIPNYNYARYIGETIASVLSQQAPRSYELEIDICDNASTDESVDVIRAITDERVRLSVNECNVGFAPNLERVASMARGRRMLLLSSDDRMAPGALAAYCKLEAALADLAAGAVWGAATNVIDANGVVTGRVDPDPKLWRDAQPEPALSLAVGLPVRSLAAADLLRRSLLLLRSPLPFASTCYPRALHNVVGGYTGGRMMNPDKHFLWKVLSVADRAYVIDAPLFDYRVHDAGQAPQEQRSGALKHLTDEYVSSFSLGDSVLARAGISRDELAAAFVEQDVALRGLVALAKGQRTTARRGVHFGIAAYPQLARRNPKVWALRSLLALGPLGTHLARALQARATARWQAKESGGNAD